MTTMCTVYAVSASDPTAASGARTPRPPVGDHEAPARSRAARRRRCRRPRTWSTSAARRSQRGGPAEQVQRDPRAAVPEDHEPDAGQRAEAAQPRRAQVAAADREPDQQVRRPDDRGVVVADGRSRRAPSVARPRGPAAMVCRSGGPSDGDDPRGRQQSRPATSAARRSRARTAARTSAGSPTTGVAEDDEELPEARTAAAARTRMRTRACTSRVPVTGSVLPESSASDRPARTTNSAAGRPSASCAKPPGRDRAVVVGTDVRGHHPEHGEATGDVDPHDAAHARMLASAISTRVISHVETVRPGY